MVATKPNASDLIDETTSNADKPSGDTRGDEASDERDHGGPEPTVSHEREIVGLSALTKLQQVELAIAKVSRQKELEELR